MSKSLHAMVIAAIGFALPTPLLAETDAGSYLAARQAGFDGDYVQASRYFMSALQDDPSHVPLMEQTLTSLLGTGQVDQAANIAAKLNDLGMNSQIANIAVFAYSVKAGDWDAVFTMLEEGHEVGPLLDGLGQAWAYVGKGQMDRALMSFDEVIDTPGLGNFGQQHKAMALTMVGDLEAAEAIYSLPPSEGIVPTRASVIAHLQILCRLGDFAKAGDMMDRAFGSASDPELAALRNAIEAGDIPAIGPVVSTPAEGIAFAMVSLSNILQGEANESYLLLYAQAARYLAPDDAAADIAAARLLNEMGQYDTAARTFAEVSPSDMAFHEAELGRAEALRLGDHLEQATEVLSNLTRSYPDLPRTYVSLGDALRQQGDYEGAKEAYDAALARYPEGASARWWVLYTRGIAQERMGAWDGAEADFRASLALNPDHPSVLNYLGYSLVDRGMSAHYEEALEMIKTAVAERPNSGAITDSLGWAYYKLGRFEEAVTPLETAAELAPNDPVISDHLGDAYWMVGRYNEAEFQWRRALSFGPEAEVEDRIRRKLQVGLDAVYAEEGFTPPAPVEVASDDRLNDG